MKIPFTLDAWLKDKNQKVETRDGRIVHNIWCVKEPFYTNNKKAEVCALIDGEEDALVFFEGGRYLPTTQDIDSPFDLFIITTDQELTEFEKAIKDLVLAIDEGELQELGVFEEENLGAWAVKKAAELLDLVRKELEQEWPSIIQAQSFNAGLKQGKAEALKDLPRWKKVGADTGQINLYKSFLRAQNYLEVDGRRIMLSELEKLPGFKED